MALTCVDVIDQYFSDGGLVGNGYKVRTREGGTTTPRVTYTDSTGNTEHTNPVVMLSNGRPPGDGIWCTQGVAYKFELMTDADVVIETVDNVVFPLATQAVADTAHEQGPYHKGALSNNNETVWRFNFTRSVDYLANFLGSYGSVDTNPAATWTGLVKKNGSNIGTIVVTTGGVVSFTTSGGASQSFAASDVMTVIGPASADASIAGLAVTFAGEVA